MDALAELERLRAEALARLKADPTFVAFEEVSACIERVKKGSGESTVSVRRPRHPTSQRNIIFSVLKDAGRPMTKAELFDALDLAGNPVCGTNRVSNLTGILRRDQRFVALPDGRWGLAEMGELIDEENSENACRNSALA